MQVDEPIGDGEYIRVEVTVSRVWLLYPIDCRKFDFTTPAQFKLLLAGDDVE